MSAIDTRTSARREAAKDAAERRKKLMLAVLMVVFAALLAFQLPKLLKPSSSSSGTASTSLVTPATPAVPVGGSTPLHGCGGEAPAPDPAAGGRGPVRAAHSASTNTPSSAATKPAHAVRPGQSAGGRQDRALHAGRAVARGDLDERPAPAGRSGPDVQDRRSPVPPRGGDEEGAAPRGGRRHFRWRQTSDPVRQGHPLKLANTATGVQYRLLFTSRSEPRRATTPGDN